MFWKEQFGNDNDTDNNNKIKTVKQRASQVVSAVIFSLGVICPRCGTVAFL